MKPETPPSYDEGNVSLAFNARQKVRKDRCFYSTLGGLILLLLVANLATLVYFRINARESLKAPKYRVHVSFPNMRQVGTFVDGKWQPIEVKSPTTSNTHSTDDGTLEIKWDGLNFMMELETDGTLLVDQLRQRLASLSGISATDQMLTVRQEVLQDGFALSHYGIGAGSTVTMSKRQPIKIYLWHSSHGAVWFDVHTSDTIRAVKEKVWSGPGVFQKKSHTWIYNGVELSDNWRTLFEYGVRNASQVGW